MRKLLAGSLSLAFILFFWNPMAARGEIKRSIIDDYHLNREPDVKRILSVLEMRIGDHKLLEKAKDKLLTLKDSEFNLIASLSERITREGERPGIDIVFLLITALIILS